MGSVGKDDRVRRIFAFTKLHGSKNEYMFEKLNVIEEIII